MQFSFMYESRNGGSRRLRASNQCISPDQRYLTARWFDQIYANMDAGQRQPVQW